MYAETNRQVTTHALSSTFQLSGGAVTAPVRSKNVVGGAELARRQQPAGIVTRLMRMWADWRARRDLQRLPDHVLSDIGLSRADVDREALQPFWTPLDYDTLETQRRRAAMTRSNRYY
ncbi:MAG TPA: DUF1127 domain-containing protein [Geminicoccus sp.]|uniref:DUF1127 domain-containing protein n=1 Tax=Geminicoccus sp. TaxID=2024832 RepID=UPI002C6BC5B7|nr:DUF1127 domain-containing protein [Geminicoccus sp.]HWL72047.1 DUF1127 domain-containing protein [Geminicoccus sp.]